MATPPLPLRAAIASGQLLPELRAAPDPAAAAPAVPPSAPLHLSPAARLAAALAGAGVPVAIVPAEAAEPAATAVPGQPPGAGTASPAALAAAIETALADCLGGRAGAADATTASREPALPPAPTPAPALPAPPGAAPPAAGAAVPPPAPTPARVARAALELAQAVASTTPSDAPQTAAGSTALAGAPPLAVERYAPALVQALLDAALTGQAALEVQHPDGRRARLQLEREADGRGGWRVARVSVRHEEGDLRLEATATLVPGAPLGVDVACSDAAAARVAQALPSLRTALDARGLAAVVRSQRLD